MAEKRETSASGSDIEDGNDDDTNEPVSKPQLSKTKVARIPSILKPPSFYSMVIDALMTLDTGGTNKGVSVVAIRSFIVEKYKTVDPNTTKSKLRKAIAKGLENGIIKRPKAFADYEAKLTGRFRYDKTTIEKKEKLAEKAKAKAKAEAEARGLDSKKKSKSKPKAKTKPAEKKNEKSTLKSTRQTPAKVKTKSKTAKSISNTPKKATPKMKLVAEMAKDKKKKKDKASPKSKAATKPKSAPKKKVTPKKKAVSNKKEN